MDGWFAVRRYGETNAKIAGLIRLLFLCQLAFRFQLDDCKIKDGSPTGQTPSSSKTTIREPVKSVVGLAELPLRIRSLE